MTAIRINGTDIGTTFGWYPDALPQWLPAPIRTMTTVPVSGRGGVLVSTTQFSTPRTLGIYGTLQTTTVTLRRGFEAQIAALCHGGLVTISVEDGLTSPRTIRGYCTRLDVAPFGPSIAPLASRINAEFLCPDPYWFDQEPTSQVLGTTRKALTLGPAPSTGFVRIITGTNPVLTYRDAAGTAQKTMTFTVTLAATNDWLDIDMRLGRITKYLTGVASNGLSLLTSGDFPWAFDPQDGDPSTASYPSLELSTGTGIAHWWKAYP